MEKKYKLKGHESFVLREGWLTKGLRAVKENNRLFSVNSGADALGVGTNMAKSIRYWLKASGLVTESFSKGVNLTEIGEVLLENDLYFEDVFSLWLVHVNIATNGVLATSWNLFFNNMNVVSAFSRDEFCDMMRDLILEHTGETEISDRSVRDDCSAILSMYCKNESANTDPEDKKESPFAELGLVEQTGKKYIKKRPFLDQIDPLIVLYLILDELNAQGSMQIDHVVNGNNMPGKILNLNRIAVNSYLDELARGKYIIMNRTAGLDIIYPDKCKEYNKAQLIKEYFGRKTSI